jgi:hypothetical protein
VRLDLGGRKLPGQHLDLSLVGRQLEIHGASIWLAFITYLS